MLKSTSIRLTVLFAVAVLFLTPSSAWSVLLTDEEADQQLREMGLNIDDPSFPPDLLDAFRAMMRGMFATEEWTPEDSTASGGETQTMALISGPDLDELCSPLSEDFHRENRGWIYEVDASRNDDDGSGVGKLMRYVLGLEPENGLRNCLPRPELKEHNGEKYLALTFLRPNWVQGIRYVIESSDDLVNWTRHSDPIVLTEPLSSGPSHYQRVWFLDEDSGHSQARLFLRMRITYY
jgi:hypothetical protein